MTLKTALDLISHKLAGDRAMPNSETLSLLFFEALCETARRCVPERLIAPDDYEGAIFRVTRDGEIIKTPTYPTQEEIDDASTQTQGTGTGQGQTPAEVEIDEELSFSVVNFVCAAIAENSDKYKAAALSAIAAYESNK